MFWLNKITFGYLYLRNEIFSFFQMVPIHHSHIFRDCTSHIRKCAFSTHVTYLVVTYELLFERKEVFLLIVLTRPKLNMHEG